MKCNLENGSLYYETYGNGRPLLVLHGGYRDHKRMVSAIEPAFEAKPGWMRIFPHLPGHGITSIADGYG